MTGDYVAIAHPVGGSYGAEAHPFAATKIISIFVHERKILKQNVKLKVYIVEGMIPITNERVQYNNFSVTLSVCCVQGLSIHDETGLVKTVKYKIFPGKHSFRAPKQKAI